MERFTAVEVIRAKRDALALSDAQIDWIVDAYTRDAVAEEQMSALAMAIYLNGMTDAETARWTAAMVDSGTRLALPNVGKPLVDKHSTGGVGDKITLPLAPLMAACGVAVPQLSGRGLGHTGGTLDKLEAIPGWRAALSESEISAQLSQVGAVVCAATPTLAPADRKLYALRDVTATVESIPLIASSIMSKKIAEGTKALVLDVKVGTGAFVKDEARARQLAEALVGIGSAHGVATTAVLTSMSVPLGFAVGNAVEVVEALEVLSGAGPADVRELTLVLAREMLALAGLSSVDAATVLDSGAALAKWREMVAAQGGDPAAALPRARFTRDILAPRAGSLSRCDAYEIGMAAWRLGAGRARKEDAVSAAAGVQLFVKPGDQMCAGDLLARLHCDAQATLDAVEPDVVAALVVGKEAVEPSPLVIDIIRA